MDHDSSGSVALLAVHPKYAALLMSGEKRVEFRKTRFSQDVRLVVVYASSPIRLIVGYFLVDELDEGTPDEVWVKYHSIGGIDEADFRSYYGDSDRAIAILIDEAVRFDPPLPLSHFKANNVPPQSYEYIEDFNLGLLARA